MFSWIIRPWPHFSISHTLFSSCFSQAATDWPPNKAGHYQTPDNCILLPTQGSIQDSLYIQSAKQNFCKLSDSTLVTLRSSGMHLLRQAAWAGLSTPQAMNLHRNSGPLAASKNPDTGQVPFSVGLHEKCLVQTTCRRSPHKQDATKQSCQPKHQASSALKEPNNALSPYCRNCWQNTFSLHF